MSMLGFILLCLLLASPVANGLEGKLRTISSLEGDQKGSSGEESTRNYTGVHQEDSGFPLFARLVGNTTTSNNESRREPLPPLVASPSSPNTASKSPVSERARAFRDTIEDYPKYQLFAGIAAIDRTSSITIPSQHVIATKGIGAAFTIAFSVFLLEHSRDNATCLFASGFGEGDRTPSMWILPKTRKLEYRVSSTVYKNVWGTSAQDLPLWRWMHVALVSDGMGRLDLFLNGELDSTLAVVGIVLSNVSPLTVGGDPLRSGGMAGLVAQMVYLPFRLSKAAVWLEAESARGNLPDLEEFAQPFAVRTGTGVGEVGKSLGGGPEEEIGEHLLKDKEVSVLKEEEGESLVLELVKRAGELEDRAVEDGGSWGLAKRTGRELLTAAVAAHEEAAVHGQVASHYSLAVLLAGGLHLPSEEGRAVFHLLMAAARGKKAQREAAMALGWRHTIGLGVPQCNRTAMWYYEKLAREVYGKLNDPEEQLTLEQVQLMETTREERADDLRGEGGNVAEALRLRAQQGDALSAVAVAQRYLHGLWGMPRDAAAALRFFRIAHERGHAYATLNLARMHLYGEGGLAKNHTRAYEHYKSVADREETSGALAGLGYLHFHGFGTEQNRTLAFDLFRRAAALGSLDAMMNVGLMLRYGWATERDPAAAVGYFREAASHGHTPSAYQMALVLVDGDGVPRSLGEAARYFRLVAEVGGWGRPLQEGLHAYVAGHSHLALAKYQRAAELGYAVAQYNVAWILHTEFNTGPHKDAAARLARKYQQRVIAEAGSRRSEKAWAHIQLGDCHYYGTACEVNMTESVAHYREAAALKEPQACFNLGLMLEHGLGGLPCDVERAERMYEEIWDPQSPGKEAALAALIHLRGVRFWRNSGRKWRSFLRFLVEGGPKPGPQRIMRPKQTSEQAQEPPLPISEKGKEETPREIEEKLSSSRGEEKDRTIDEEDWVSDVEDFLLGFLVGVLTIILFRIWWQRNVRAGQEPQHQVPTLVVEGAER